MTSFLAPVVSVVQDDQGTVAHPRHPWHPWPLLGATGLSGDGAQPRAVEANACADPGDEFFAVLNSKSFHVFFCLESYKRKVLNDFHLSNLSNLSPCVPICPYLLPH